MTRNPIFPLIWSVLLFYVQVSAGGKWIWVTDEENKGGSWQWSHDGSVPVYDISPKEQEFANREVSQALWRGRDGGGGDVVAVPAAGPGASGRNYYREDGGNDGNGPYYNNPFSYNNPGAGAGSDGGGGAGAGTVAAGGDGGKDGSRDTAPAARGGHDGHGYGYPRYDYDFNYESHDAFDYNGGQRGYNGANGGATAAPGASATGNGGDGESSAAAGGGGGKGGKGGSGAAAASEGGGKGYREGSRNAAAAVGRGGGKGGKGGPGSAAQGGGSGKRKGFDKASGIGGGKGGGPAPAPTAAGKNKGGSWQWPLGDGSVPGMSAMKEFPDKFKAKMAEMKTKAAGKLEEMKTLGPEVYIEKMKGYVNNLLDYLDKYGIINKDKAMEYMKSIDMDHIKELFEKSGMQEHFEDIDMKGWIEKMGILQHVEEFFGDDCDVKAVAHRNMEIFKAIAKGLAEQLTSKLKGKFGGLDKAKGADGGKGGGGGAAASR